MKIRYDFVTNSSSTSFIIISDGEFNLKDFIEATGVKNDSEFMFIYNGLFEAFKDNMIPIRKYYNDYHSKGQSFEDYIKDKFIHGAEMLPKIYGAESKGKLVYMGSLSSDGDDIENFFCTDAFILESDKIFIDARENGW